MKIHQRRNQVGMLMGEAQEAAGGREGVHHWGRPPIVRDCCREGTDSRGVHQGHLGGHWSVGGCEGCQWGDMI